MTCHDMSLLKFTKGIIRVLSGYLFLKAAKHVWETLSCTGSQPNGAHGSWTALKPQTFCFGFQQARYLRQWNFGQLPIAKWIDCRQLHKLSSWQRGDQLPYHDLLEWPNQSDLNLLLGTIRAVAQLCRENLLCQIAKVHQSGQPSVQMSFISLGMFEQTKTVRLAACTP